MTNRRQQHASHDSTTAGSNSATPLHNSRMAAREGKGGWRSGTGLRTARTAGGAGMAGWGRRPAADGSGVAGWRPVAVAAGGDGVRWRVETRESKRG